MPLEFLAVDASTTIRGLVNITSQSFSGAKTFTGLGTFSSGLTVSAGTLTFTGFSGVLTASGGVITSSAQLSVALGGTNIGSYTAGDVLYASGSTTLSKLGIGSTNGAIMMSNGSNAPSWVTSIPATITFSNGATISGGLFTLNTNETCTLTTTSTAPTHGRADVDLWQPSGSPTTDFYAYYQQAEYANNQVSTFGIAGLRADVITTAALTSATLARADSMYAFYAPGGAGTVSQATGLRVGQASALSGTTTNYNGVRVDNNVASGTITNSAGLYIDTIGGKGGTTGASIYLVSDGTAKTGLSWGTSTSAYTADVGLFRSGAGTITITGSATITNGLTISSGSFTIGSNVLTLSSSSTLSTNSQSLIMTASMGNFTFAAGSGTSATTHNFVQSGTTQYVLESATAPTALGDMYYASTTSYATMTKLSIGVRGSHLVANGATPTPTWLAPSATAGVAMVSGGTGADLAYGTVVVAGGGTGQTSFASTNSLLVSGSSSTVAFTTVTGAAGLLYGTAANTAPTFVTSVGTLITFSAGLTVTGAKTTFAATTTGYASANIPSGTSPTTPTNGDLWWDGTHLYFYNGSSNVNLLTGSGGTVTGTGTGGQIAYWSATTVLTGGSGFTYSGGQLTVSGASGSGIVDTVTGLATTSTQGFVLQNTTASTGGATQQQSPAFDYIGHAWNTTPTAADNFVRYRNELQVTSAGTPSGTLVWKSSVDTGATSFTNQMTLTTGGLLTVANGLTISAGSFTLGSNTLSLTTSSTLSTNSQSLIMTASMGNFTFAAGAGTSATTHNFVQSGTAQYVLESATAPTALGDMYYASTTSYATMTKLSIGARGATLVANTATPTPTWLAPSATAGVAIISGGTGADLAYGTIVVAGGGTGQASFASTNSLLVSGSSSTGAFTTVTGAAGLLYGTAANTAPTFVTSVGTAITFTAGLTVTTNGITDTVNALATTSTLGFALQNTTASTSGATQQQSPGFDFIGHVWNTTVTAADNTARFRTELQVTSGTTPVGTLVWKSSVDTGTASFTNRMTLTSAGLLTVSNGLTVSAGSFTLGSFTLSLSSSSTLSTNSQTLTVNASTGNVTLAAGSGSSATQHNLVQSGTTQYVLESATAPTALGDMYYASTTSYATMTKLSIGVRGANFVASGATPTPTWLAPSATAGIAIISGGTGADLAYGTIVVAGGGTGQASFASTNSLLVSGSSSTGAFTTVTGAAGLLYGTAANTAPTFVTSVGTAITFTAGLTVTTNGIVDTINALTTTSTQGFALQNTTASTSGATQQQSPGFDFIGHVWNTTATAADNTARFRTELQVTSANAPIGTLVWKSSVDTGAASFTNVMTLTSLGALTLSMASLAATSTAGLVLQNTTASTSGATQQQSQALDMIGHAWNTTVTAADNFVRYRRELQVTSGATPSGTLVWKSSVDTGTASYTNQMTLTTGGLLTTQGGLTVNGAKTTLAATATGYASLNLPSGTVPTSPATGDLYFDGNILWHNDGTTAKRINKHQASIVMCAGFTPSAGADTAEFVVPYKGDGTTSITWNVRRIYLRVGTASGSNAAINIEYSTGAGNFSAATVGSATISSNNEVAVTSGFSVSTLTSGYKVRFNVTTLGASTNWTIQLDLEEA